jgi:hypothetical protein
LFDDIIQIGRSLTNTGIDLRDWAIILITYLCYNRIAETIWLRPQHIKKLEADSYRLEIGNSKTEQLGKRIFKTIRNYIPEINVIKAFDEYLEANKD